MSSRSLSLNRYATPGEPRSVCTAANELFIPYSEHSANRPFQIRISADDIIVATQNPEGISAGNVLPGTIRTIDLLEGQAMLTVFAGEEFYVQAHRRRGEQARPARRQPGFSDYEDQVFPFAVIICIETELIEAVNRPAT